MAQKNNCVFVLTENILRQPQPCHSGCPIDCQRSPRSLTGQRHRASSLYNVESVKDRVMMLYVHVKNYYVKKCGNFGQGCLVIVYQTAQRICQVGIRVGIRQGSGADEVIVGSHLKLACREELRDKKMKLHQTDARRDEHFRN